MIQTPYCWNFAWNAVIRSSVAVQVHDRRSQLIEDGVADEVSKGAAGTLATVQTVA